MEMIDLRSDTLTKPTPAMLEAMMTAEVGDDVFGEDPTVNRLESKAAAMFGLEAGLFCPSGTMTNQIAIKGHTRPLDEVICDKLAHIYNYETGAFAMISGVSMRCLNGDRGRFTAAQVREAIQPDFDWHARTSLVCVENTVNKGGGAVYNFDDLIAIQNVCREHRLIYHLDGARIFNALVAQGKTPEALHGMFQSISVCLSKGLGTPAGSVLLGSRSFIKECRRIRKALGGSMRQSGFLAAAGIFALDNNIDRLAQDHAHAKAIAATLSSLNWVKQVLPVETNIIVFEVEDAYATMFSLLESGIKSAPFSDKLMRMVTHLDIDANKTDQCIEALKRIK